MGRLLSSVVVYCLFRLTLSQVTTRQCSANSTVASSRCAAVSDVLALSTCKTFCASSTQATTTLYSTFCASTSTCVVGSTCNYFPCNIDISGPSTVDVPCGYNLDGVVGADLTITNGCGSSTTQFIVAEVAASNKADGTPYVVIDPTTGKWSRSANVVTQNLTQTYEVTLVNLPSGQTSNSINVTFNFASCLLGLTGPDSARVCVGFPPNTPIADQTAAGSTETRNLWLYPQLTFAATNVPPLMPVIFDLEKDAAIPGLGAASTVNMGIYSPDVISSTGDFASGTIWISNYNVLTGKLATDTIGIYGASADGDIPTCSTGATVDPAAGTPGSAVTAGTCCQTLRFSVSPGVAETPLQAGSKDVLVCYEDTANCAYT